MCKTGSFYLLFFCLLFLTPGVRGDQLELVNGDRISGTIIFMDGKLVRMETGYGTVEIPREDILRGQFGDPATGVAVSSGGGGTEAAETETPARGIVEVRSGISRRGLICEYLFNANFKDTSANKLPLQQHGQLLFTGGFDGNPRGAVLSDGTGTYLELESQPLLDSLSRFTFSCWFFVEGEAGSQYLVSKWENTTGKQAVGKFALSYSRGQLFFYIVGRNGDYHGLKVQAQLGLKSWHHVAATFGDGTLAVYLDGELLGSEQISAAGLLSDPAPLYLLTARSFTPAAWSFYNLAGRLDNVRLYDRVLSIPELQALAEEGS